MKSITLPKVLSMVAAAMLAACLLVFVWRTDSASATTPGQNGKIAFQSFSSKNASNYEIYSMNPDGTGRVQLTHNAARDEYPAQSPDGTKIAFSRAGIWVMDADGSNITQLTNTGDYGPTWSPDGAKIAFTRDDAGQQDVWVMNADGAEQTKVTSPPHSGFLPAWSPDGTKIAYTSGNDIWTINADGSDPTQLTNTPAIFENEADWSPDGKYLAFESDQDGQTFDVYKMNADGSGVTRLTDTPATTYGQPSWSPDGTKIAFTGIGDIWTMNADGSNQTNLTNTSSDFEGEPDWGVHSQDEPQITPDEPQAPTPSVAQYEDRASQGQPERTPPTSRSEKVLPNTVSKSPLPNTGGPSLLLVASALLFCGSVAIYREVKRGF